MGRKIFTELRKPTLMPLQASPVQALDQAVDQAVVSKALGQAEEYGPGRISSMVLSEVRTITTAGSRKKAAATSRKE